MRNLQRSGELGSQWRICRQICYEVYGKRMFLQKYELAAATAYTETHKKSNNPKSCRGNTVSVLSSPLKHASKQSFEAAPLHPLMTQKVEFRSFDFKPLVPQSMRLYEPTSWAAYCPGPWCCSAFKQLVTIWHLRRATGIPGMPGHAMFGRHHDHHGTLWPCSQSFWMFLKIAGMVR